jgi:hypothetical protein
MFESLPTESRKARPEVLLGMNLEVMNFLNGSADVMLEHITIGLCLLELSQAIKLCTSEKLQQT